MQDFFFWVDRKTRPTMSVDQVRADIESATHLSASTRVTLQSRTKRLFETAPFPKKVVAKVLPQISERESTQLAYLQAILSIMKLSPTFRTLVGDSQRRSVLREAEVLKDKELQRRESGETRSSDLTWDEVLDCESHFPLGSEALLLHRLYTHLPTVRSDFTPLKIVQTRDQVTDSNMNYFVVDDDPVFVLQEYKTSGRYGRQEFPLPDSILELLPDDRDYLFEASPGVPILANTLSKKIVRAYERYCGKHVTINVLRRAYASSTKGSVDDAIAQGHSVNTHKQYAARG